MNAPLLSYPTAPNHASSGFFSNFASKNHITVFPFSVRLGKKDYISIPEMPATTLLTFLLNQESYRKARAGLPNLGTTDFQAR